MGEGRVDPIMKELMKIQDLRDSVRQISLNSYYVPNKLAHLERYHSSDILKEKKSYTSNISEDVVEKIMLIET